MNTQPSPEFKNFARENFWPKKKRILRGSAKSLCSRRLRKIWKNFQAFRFQKSTPFENLALTFEKLACLKLSKTRQKNAKNAAQNRLFVQFWPLPRHFFTDATPPQRPKTPIFHSRMLRNRELFLVEILNTIFPCRRPLRSHLRNLFFWFSSLRPVLGAEQFRERDIKQKKSNMENAQRRAFFVILHRISLTNVQLKPQ